MTPAVREWSGKKQARSIPNVQPYGAIKKETANPCWDMAVGLSLHTCSRSIMLARVYSCAVVGLDGVVVEVEVDTSSGLPKVIIRGPITRCTTSIIT